MITNEALIVKEYSGVVKRMLGYMYPNMTTQDFEKAIQYSINKRYREESCYVYNDYKNKTVDMNLLELTEYIISRKPIICNYGVMFKQHGTVINPLTKMIEKFMENRGVLKKEMFKHPKGSEEYEKYNLLQLLAKLDANGLYGCIGNSSCLFYNLHVACATTAQGRSYVSAAGMFFEQFLSNNVKFGSLDQIITFFDNIINEKPNRRYNDKDFLDRDITVEECFNKVVMTCGFNWIPNEEELDTIWVMMHRFSQEDINRIYYKNNLYDFMSNETMIKCIKLLLSHMTVPFLDPNSPPKAIKPELDAFCDILKEYVYYGHQIIDRIDRMDNMIKNIAVISDTDSCYVSFDPWYRFAKDIVKDMDLEIKKQYVDAVTLMDYDEFDEKIITNAIHKIEPEYDFDFENDELIEMRTKADVATILPENNLRYSIINIMAYTITQLLDDFFIGYTKRSNSWNKDKKCLIIMKNEYLVARTLLTMNKKNYAGKQELQEGNPIPEKQSLDIKGLAINKPPLTENMRKELKNILFNDILNTDKIDQTKVIKDLAILEKKIFNSLKEGEKTYYKSVTIKSYDHYDDPMRIQGIKASVVWNAIKDDDFIALDLSTRNAIDIVKVNINDSTVEKIKDLYPSTYNKIVELLKNKDFKGCITSLAIPKDSIVPEWLQYFIDYTTIINDNISCFPLESIGVSKLDNNNINYTNIIQI